MRKRALKKLWARLKQLSAMTLTHKELLMKLGAARSQYPAGWRLIEVRVEELRAAFTCRLNRDKLKQARRREGRYLLRTHLTGTDPAELWRYYIQLAQVEEAFKSALASNYPPNPRPKSPPHKPSQPPACSADLRGCRPYESISCRLRGGESAKLG